MISVTSGGIRLDVDGDENLVTIWDINKQQRLLILRGNVLFAPVIDGREPALRFKEVIGGETFSGENSAVLHFESEEIDDFQVTITARSGHLEFSSRFTVRETTQLNRLILFPQGTKVNMYDLVNFRNRHYTPHTWPELNWGVPFATNTYSGDWQFAPHPTMFILRKNEAALLFAAIDLPTSYGMYLEAEDFSVKLWDLDYGPLGYGQIIQAGTTFESPRFCMFLEEGKSVQEIIGSYTSLLAGLGNIPDPAGKERFQWHTENVYCTWLDQGYISDVILPAQLNEQAVNGTLDKAADVMDERLVRDALDVIGREQLLFRTILLDVGWQKATGDWLPHPMRFPDLRKLVDDIHSRGMKVVVWWNWAELYDEVIVDDRHLMGGGKRNKHGSRMRDYSNPVTRDDYLEPLFRKLFSPEPDCFDLDGVKTDFLADKIHAEMPLSDPSWRGEENYFYRMFGCFYRLMRKYKPDACHIGCSGHPYLAGFIDVNRTYDVFSSDVREHLHRGDMLRSTSPGCPVALDFHGFMENLPEYFDTAARGRFSVQIGNILGMKRDIFSPWEPAEQIYYDILRTGLRQLADRTRRYGERG